MFKDVQDTLEGIMNRKKFLSSLKIVLRGAEKSSFLNNSLVYFDDGKLSSFSDSMYISCPVGSTFTCQVEMKTLFDVLSKMTDRNIRIRFKKNYLLVEGEKAKLKLKLKVSRQRTKLTRLRRKAGVGFEGFRNFATKVSKTRIAQGELGGTVFKGKRRKRNDFLF